ncbi:MAG: hypothetical protein KF905_16160 [Flavobacteriales bacterium]|nr:hypothetical protein [Flavobacteriales bacterium]
MRTRYRITPEGRSSEPSEQELARYRDPKRLVYNYLIARDRFHKKPLYKDPKAFLALLLIILVTLMIAEAAEKERAQQQSHPEEQVQP